MEVSVRELAEDEEFRRIGFERGEGWHRLGLGAELHARVLKERKNKFPEYRSEVHLQNRWAVEDWTALVTGRLDGCAPKEGGGWLVEEFKSAYLPGSGAVMERHKTQLLVYCHLWSRMGNAAITGSLIYVDLASGEELRVPVDYDEAEMEHRIQGRLRALLAVWRAESKIREEKAIAAGAMPFPHDEPRPGQKLMIDAVRESLETGGNLLAEAPTGSGKTAASLYPALAHGLPRESRWFF